MKAKALYTTDGTSHTGPARTGRGRLSWLAMALAPALLTLQASAAGLPSVNTGGGAISTSATTADLHGQVTTNTPADAFICWEAGAGGSTSTLGDTSTWDNVSGVINVTDDTVFSIVASNLSYGIEYSYAVLATNSGGEAWSSVTNFTTIPPLTVSGSQDTVRNVNDDGSSVTNLDFAALGTSDWACWAGATGAPAQQKADGTAIGDLQTVETPGGPNSWEFTSFVWASGGSPLASASSPGYAAGVTSRQLGGSDAGDGYSIDIELPGREGTITFWGVGRDGSNILTLELDGSVLYSDSHSARKGEWDVTTFTLDWTLASKGDTVTVKYLYSGTGGAARVGATGVAVSVTRPFAGGMVFIIR